MKPSTYIHVFAGIAIAALCLQIFSDFWLPLVIGAGLVVTVMVLSHR